jgi:predicted transcriptional regulator
MADRILYVVMEYGYEHRSRYSVASTTGRVRELIGVYSDHDVADQVAATNQDWEVRKIMLDAVPPSAAESAMKEIARLRRLVDAPEAVSDGE